eukprot:m.97125 g.97125  ORF g.97125 m.97125 type:complete len:56 (+) comp14816_c1_seq2:2040-2207(+)
MWVLRESAGTVYYVDWTCTFSSNQVLVCMHLPLIETIDKEKNKPRKKCLTFVTYR